MSSLEVAELTGKRHSDVLRDIRNIVLELDKAERKTALGYNSTTYIDASGQSRPCYSLSKSACLLLVTGYDILARDKLISRWQYLEEQLKVLQFRVGDKKHQLAAMAALQHMLPEDLKGEAEAFFKINTVCNKAVSNLFGFPKMLKKDEMSDDMLVVRERVLDDYLKLFEVLEDNSEVSKILYSKYQPKRLTVDIPT